MADFRLCLTCPSHSQADLYHYARKLISDQLESTFAHLRYSLGGDRPSQTTDHAVSEFLNRIHLIHIVNIVDLESFLKLPSI